jgi:hypothetical protein
MERRGRGGTGRVVCVCMCVCLGEEVCVCMCVCVLSFLPAQIVFSNVRNRLFSLRNPAKNRQVNFKFIPREKSVFHNRPKKQKRKADDLQKGKGREE